MDLFREGLQQAFELIRTFDSEVFGAALRSLWVSALAVGLATAAGLPLGTALARIAFPGRRFFVLAFRTGMAFPTVFIGIVCYALLFLYIYIKIYIKN